MTVSDFKERACQRKGDIAYLTQVFEFLKEFFFVVTALIHGIAVSGLQTFPIKRFYIFRWVIDVGFVLAVLVVVVVFDFLILCVGWSEESTFDILRWR